MLRRRERHDLQARTPERNGSIAVVAASSQCGATSVSWFRWTCVIVPPSKMLSPRRSALSITGTM